MSQPSWVSICTRALHQLSPTGRPLRLSLVGVGQELRGDDAAGLLVVRALMRRLPLQQDQWPASDHLTCQIFEAGAAPENATGLLRRFAPHLVILIDAAQLRAEPGTAQWLPWQAAVGFSASTHTLPLNLVSQYLQQELGAQVALLGIQPAQLGLGQAVSPSVLQATLDIGHTLQDVLFSWKPEP